MVVLKLKYCLLFFLFGITTAYSQGIIKNFNSSYGLGEYPNAMKITSSGEIIVAGSVQLTALLTRGFVTKFDAAFNIIWSKEIYVSGSCYLYGLVLTPDNGYLVAGCIETSLMNPYGLYMAKLDSSGNVLWSHCYEGFILADVCLTNDSGFVAAGQTIRPDSTGGHSVICVTYVDSSGNLIWTNTFGGPTGGEVALAMKQDLDNCFIVTGISYSLAVSVNSMYLLKIKNIGGMLWAKTYDCINFDHGKEIILNADSGYLILGIGGHTWSTYSTPSPSLMKTDKDGNILWAKVYIDSLWPTQSEGYNAVQTSDKGYALLFYGPTHNTYVLKTDSSGNLQWVKKFGLKKYDAQGGLDVDSNDDLIYTSGTVNNGDDIELARIQAIDSCGEEITTYKDTTYNPVVQNVSYTEIRLFQNNAVTTIVNDLVLIDSLVCGNLGTTVNSYSEIEHSLMVFPNPSRGIFHISVSEINPYQKLNVFNALGESIFNLETKNQESLDIDLSGQVPGIYLLRFESGNQYQTARICLVD